MTSDQIAAVVLALAVLLALAHLLGHAFERLRQPRLVGEILAGVVVGPYVLGRVAPQMSRQLLGGTGSEGDATRIVLSFGYWLGLLLLMFISGTEVRRVLGSGNRRPTAWILGIGTPLPFVIALLVGSALPLEAIAGPRGGRSSVLLVLAIAVAVTSIPVISRIFYDLRILHTRFASLVLGAALLEDIALWAVLAVATALASASAVDQQVTRSIGEHVGATLGYMAAGLSLAPAILRRFHTSRWNVLRAASPVGYAILILLAYAAVAALLGVNLVFAAFLAGFGLVGGVDGSHRRLFSEQLDAIQKVAFAVFVPLYFAVVGSQLQLGAGFSPWLLAAFLLGSSALCLLSIGLAARAAGFRGLEVVNLAVACNARGGPGIVLASVAYEAGIIDGAFFTTLVLTAVLTSQFAGAWLRYVLRRGWPLLREDAMDVVPPDEGARELDLASAADGVEAAPSTARTEGEGER
ncbi:MAG TPA: cation:proton antiporter [Actinomycetota bacterium]|nr:cation:proton antiporter [Actinomycetota bacterium]